MNIINQQDIVIVGSGAAGLFAALSLAPRPVTILSEKPLGGICASAWAQGGFAAAVDPEDSIAEHVADTLKAAAGTAETAVVNALVGAAPAVVEILARYGVQFERDENGAYTLSREACHTRRRVLKAAAGDGFGAEMMRALAEAVRQTPSITYISGVSAERLICEAGVVKGILCRDLDKNQPVAFLAGAVLLATGGLGGLYAATTNPLHAVGRGVAMAARAGAVLSDLEFVQFHPTAMDIGEDPAPLATEALRGEGAHLLNSRGERFMPAYHDMAELAPRDIVSRGLFAQIQKGQKTYLDCRNLKLSQFPSLLASAARANLDPQRDLIPVTPAVHYHMGGIATDLNGRSTLPGLWAAGECAATGLHGANRLASNSLMEAIVMGGRAAADIASFKNEAPENIDQKALPFVPAQTVLQNERDLLRQIMTDHVGVIRNAHNLQTAIDALTAIFEKAEPVDSRTADMALVARMIAVAALQRRESRGGHCRSDYPVAVKDFEKRSFLTYTETAPRKKAQPEKRRKEKVA